MTSIFWSGDQKTQSKHIEFLETSFADQPVLCRLVKKVQIWLS